VGALQEVRLEDRLEHQLGRRLHHAILDDRNPQGALFRFSRSLIGRFEVLGSTQAM